MVSLKAALSVLAAWASLTQAAPADRYEESPALAPRASYVTTSGTLFDIDGTTKYFAGTNSYWIGFLTNNADVDLVMLHLQQSGLKVLRVWGFNDVSSTSNGVWYQSFVSGQSPQINTGANGLQRLDYVVSSAAAHDIKLVINFVNNWGDYGGMPLQATYYGITQQQWYTSAAAQANYKNYISAVVSRYKTSTAIFAWELANEPRCNGCATSVITNWATTISAYIKSLDPNHLVTLGDEGWMNGGGDGSYPYTTGEGVDFVANLKIPTLDYGTFHLYPGSWGETNAFGVPWIQNHAAACLAAGKPCVLEEYGVSSNHVAVESVWQSTSLSSKGMGGDMFWDYGDVLSTGQTSDDGNTIFYGSSDWTGLVTNHVAAINGGSSPPPASSSTTSTAVSSKTTSTSSTSSTKSTTSTTPTPTTTTTTTTTPTTPTPTSGGTVPHWGQCGGQGWTGPTGCVSPYQCVYPQPGNIWYKQCCVSASSC